MKTKPDEARLGGVICDFVTPKYVYENLDQSIYSM